MRLTHSLLIFSAMICVDNTFLTLILHPGARPPEDPNTGQPIERLADRLDLVRETWEADNEKVGIPAPVLSEFLVLADADGSQYLDDIAASTHFVVLPFDQKSAIELAAIHIASRATLGRRAQKEAIVATKAKLNFDRQIVAIAKANQVTQIYSDDVDVKNFAEQNGLEVIQTWDLPLPSAVKVPLPFPYSEEESDEHSEVDAIADEPDRDLC